MTEYKLNVKVVGNPTINGSVVSGFSANDYVETSSKITLGDGDKLEIGFLTKAPSESSTRTSSNIYNSDDKIILNISGSNVCYLTTNIKKSDNILSNDSFSPYYIELEEEVYCKFIIDNSTKKMTCGFSRDGINYEYEHRNTSPSLYVPLDGIMSIGKGSTKYGLSPCVTYIDLSKCYIKINDEYVWKGAEVISKRYILKRKIRKYYKYKYEDYTLPVMTSNTAPEGTVTTNIPTSTWTTNPYSVFWNRSASWNYWHRNATGERYLQYDFATPLAPDVYRLSLSTSRQSNVTTSIHNWYLIYEDGTKELILSYGKVPTSTTEYSGEITASKPVKAVRYELNAQASEDGRAVEYITYLNLVSKSTDYTSIRKISGGIEVSPTDDYDFYDDEVKSYVAKRKIRKYYKYVYENWTQPIATAATTVLPEGNMVITAQGNYGAAVPYKAADGSISTAWVMNEQRAGWWQIKFPYTIKITGLKFYNNQDKNRTNKARFYTSSAKIVAIGNQFTGVNTAGGLTTITGIPSEGIETDTVYLDILSSYSTSSGMSELQITAQKKTGVVEVSAEEYVPVTEGFSEYFSGFSVDMPVVTQVGSSDLYKVYWEHLKGTSGTYTEPAYTSYIKKTEFDALANESLLTQYNEDGSLFVNPKPMYKIKQYLTAGKSYRIGSPDYFFVDDIKSYVPKHKIRKYRKNFVMPVLTSNGTMGGSTFAVDCSTHNASLYKTFNAGSSGTKNVDTYPNAAPQWESFYSPVPLKVTQLRIGQIKDTTQAQYYYITAYKIQVSDDNQTWTDVYSGTGSKPATTLTANIADRGYHKYYRMYVISAPYYSSYPRVFFYGIDFDAEAEDAVFYDEVIESYAVKRKIRRYYKYEYEDWQLPNFTSATQDGIKVSATSEYSGRAGWKAVKSNIQTSATDCWEPNAASCTWTMELPYKIRISKLTHISNAIDSGNYSLMEGYYSTAEGTKIGDVSVSTKNQTIELPTDVITDKIILTKNSGGVYTGIGRLRIDARKISGVVEVSASENWDYYVTIEL